MFRSASSKQNASISDQISQIENSFKSSSIKRKILQLTIWPHAHYTHHYGVLHFFVNFPLVLAHCLHKSRGEAMGGGGYNGRKTGKSVKCCKKMIFSKKKFNILISSIVLEFFSLTLFLCRIRFLFHPWFVVIVIDTRPPSASSSLIPDSSRITNSSVWPATCDK